MGVKIRFFTSIINEKNEEIDLLNYYNDTKNGHCIYEIKGSDVCSEFIARYFNKVENMPQLLKNKVIEEHYDKDYENGVKEIHNGIYKANIGTMLQDSNVDYEFETYKECKNVRENLLNKYQEIDNSIKQSVSEPKIEIYAVLGV